ncbi:MAG: acyltransferase [Glaciimonas sp.]|nr:acyltransferase [Glaciimonas sp.]
MFKYVIKKIFGCGDWLHNYVILRINGVKFGKNLVINGRIQISNHGSIEIGDDVIINSGLRHNPIGGHTKTVFIVYSSGILKIGNRVGISNSTIVAQEIVMICDGALVGGGCNIWDTDFHSLDANIRGTTHDRGATRPVYIGEMAFLGAHSIVLKGSRIGRRSIVGAGSVASFNLPDDQIFPTRRSKE